MDNNLTAFRCKLRQAHIAMQHNIKRGGPLALMKKVVTTAHPISTSGLHNYIQLPIGQVAEYLTAANELPFSR